ncbi:MAG TPA: PadR family transcriptional regulator [Gemmatimonadales bacterium]|jgi:DNA-binding PadR family transcriptional regulator
MPPAIPELSLLEFHVLLALAAEPLYGYAIKEAIVRESGGALTPRPGSLYRVLGRLGVSGWVRDTVLSGSAPAHPGLERKYYALTRAGRRVLGDEARRLKHSATLAERRLLMPRER